MPSASNQQRLDQIKADIIEKNICPDLAKTATQLVFGDGNPSADIVFIGEAPGKNEDIKGLPFVGAAGKFLDEMLKSINLERGDVYITNIVKYRPPNNRDPLPEEKAAFLPYLYRQLLAIEPKLIVTLGRHSGETLLPTLKISRDHGHPKRIHVRFKAGMGNLPNAEVAEGKRADGVQGAAEARTESYSQYGEGALEAATPQSAANHGRTDGSSGRLDMRALVILPLFHPAAALYNGSLRQTLLDDFGTIPAILNQLHETN